MFKLAELLHFTKSEAVSFWTGGKVYAKPVALPIVLMTARTVLLPVMWRKCRQDSVSITC